MKVVALPFLFVLKSKIITVGSVSIYMVKVYYVKIWIPKLNKLFNL
jgi:hypothetical protein